MEYLTDVDKASCKFNCESPIIKNIIQLEAPLETALSLVRRLLGAPGDTKIMLSVDELSKASVRDGKNFPPASMMKSLCDFMDKDSSLYLSITSYGFVDVQQMATGSNRSLLLQPLPPFFSLYGNSDGNISLLPLVLRPFFAEEMRVLLPCSPDDMKVYSRIFDLFHYAGAHPRRLQYLLSELRKADTSFEFVLDGLNNDTAVVFARDLKDWMDESKKTYIINAICGGCSFSMELKDLSGPELKQLAKDVTVPFAFPKDVGAAERHSVMLMGTKLCFCSYLPKSPGSEEGFAYILPPVLDGIIYYSYKEPEAAALVSLNKALFEYRTSPIRGTKLPEDQTNTAQIGKALEQVALQALLLYARCDEDFSPDTFCNGNQCGSGLGLRLKGGPSVETWKDIVQFPCNGSVQSAEKRLRLTRQLLSKYVNRLEAKPDCSGALFQPSDAGNIGGDVFGLFRSATSDEYILLAVLCKDWLDRVPQKEVSPTSDSDILTKWNKSKSVLPDQVIQLKSEGNSARNVNVRVIHLLLSSDAVPVMSNPIEDNGGVITFESMRYWNPTAAYALECERGLRKRNYELPRTMAAAEGPNSE